VVGGADTPANPPRGAPPPFCTASQYADGMRILIVHPGPDFSVHDVFTGWTEALRELGCDVGTYNLNDRLIFYSLALMPTDEVDETGHPVVKQAMTQDEAFAAATQGLTDTLYKFGPQVVLFISAFFMTQQLFQLIRDHGHKMVILHTESPYQDDEQVMRGGLAHLNLLNDPANLSRFREFAPAEYMPHAYRPSVHFPRQGPRDSGLASDLCFIGTAFASRVAFFEALAAGLDGTDILIGGNDWGKTDPDSPLAPFVGSGIGSPDCVDNPQAAMLYRHALTGINFYRQEAESTWTGTGWSMGPREVEMAACGLFFLRDPRPESDEVFPMLPSFSSPEDAAAKLRWWLAHDRAREKAASLAREAVAGRTFANNAKRLLTLLDGL
jgi:spore maturation protein CgeB